MTMPQISAFSGHCMPSRCSTRNTFKGLSSGNWIKACHPAGALQRSVRVQTATEKGSEAKKPADTQEAALEKLEKEAELEERGENVFLYVGAAIAFGVAVWATQGSVKGEEYFAGYLLEQSLSVDNLFVFILCFRFFRTPAQYQPRVLNVGIWTAALLRGVMILAGVELVENFKPVLLVFAAVLLYSSYKLLFVEDDDEEEDLSQNGIVKAVNKIFTVTDSYRGDKFVLQEDGIWKVTPLFVVLAVIEISDVIFAVDSVPAVFGVTLDPFIIYTSNIAAILSLRALYGFVAAVISELRYLDKAVALVLGFIGFKMIADEAGYHISTTTSLGVVAAALAGGTALSLLLPASDDEAEKK